MAHWSLDRPWKAERRCIMKECVQLEHISVIYNMGAHSKITSKDVKHMHSCLDITPSHDTVAADCAANSIVQALPSSQTPSMPN
jgi:hypothetical protein